MKAFFKIITVVILILILALLFLWLFKTPLISSYLSRKVGVGVSIEKVDMSTTQTKMTNLEVENLPRYRSSKALTCGEVLADYSLKGLRADPTYVELVRLQDMTITLECNDPICTSNNWETIMSGMDSGSGGDYLIRKVEIINLRIDILGSGLKQGGVVTTRINRLDFNNVTSKEGIPLKQIITDIFIRANMQKYFKELMKQPQKIIKDAIPGFKFGAAPGMIKTPSDALDEADKKHDEYMEKKEEMMDERSRGRMEEDERIHEEQKRMEEEKRKIKEEQEKMKKENRGFFGSDETQAAPEEESISQEEKSSSVEEVVSDESVQEPSLEASEMAVEEVAECSQEESSDDTASVEVESEDTTASVESIAEISEE